MPNSSFSLIVIFTLFYFRLKLLASSPVKNKLTANFLVCLNIIVVYIVLRLTHIIEKILGQSGILILRKMFGIILLAIASKRFMSNLALSIGNFFPEVIN